MPVFQKRSKGNKREEKEEEKKKAACRFLYQAFIFPCSKELLKQNQRRLRFWSFSVVVISCCFLSWPWSLWTVPHCPIWTCLWVSYQVCLQIGYWDWVSGWGVFTQTWTPLWVTGQDAPWSQRSGLWPSLTSLCSSSFDQWPDGQGPSTSTQCLVSEDPLHQLGSKRRAATDWGGNFNATCTILTSASLGLNGGGGGRKGFEPGLSETFQRDDFFF